MSATNLCDAALGNLGARISVPKYDRAAITPGILHIGVGNFHRAHQATYLDRLFSIGMDHDWGIVGAGLRPNDARTRDALLAQDCLTTVIELDPDGYKATVCGSMIDYLPIDPKLLIKNLARPEIRLVTMTVTEGGYYIDDEVGGLEINHPDVLHDLEYPDDPRTVFGVLLAGLTLRRARNVPPFAIVSCDNIPNNGNTARHALFTLASNRDRDTAEWINTELAIPNGMVDCITPAVGPRERDLVEREFGIIDAMPVICEPFRQWVLENHFPAGRPALEKVGVEFVTDVAPYELMKLRILNGGHAAIAYAGALRGHHFVHDAMRDPLLRAYLQRLERTEIIPTLKPIAGVDFDAYLACVMERFANIQIGDTISRLCLDGSNRQPKFILPTVAARLAAGLPIDGLALEIAMWCQFCTGKRDDGSPVLLEDENAARLAECAHRAESDPVAFLRMTDIFGSLSAHPALVEAFSRACVLLRRAGTAGALQSYVNGSRS